MKSKGICISGAALAVLLAGSLSLAFGLCAGASGKIEPTGTNIGAVQFDAVIELNRYSPRSMRHDYTLIFARYWVARGYYNMAVVWAEPQSTDSFFGAGAPGLSIASNQESFQVSRESSTKGNEPYKKPVGQRGVFRYMFGSYPIDEVRFADQAALATRIYAPDLKGLPDPNRVGVQAFDVSIPATGGAATRDVAQLKVRASGRRIDSMEFFDAKDQLLKSINYEYEDKGGASCLRRQTVTLPERPIMVGFKGEGMKVTLDGKEYRYRDLEAREHAGGRICTVEYEPVTLGDKKVSLPARVAVCGGKDDRILRSVRMMNFKKVELDAAGAEEAARQFAAVTPDERRYEQLRLKYWEKAPKEIESEDVKAIEQLRSYFEKAVAATNTSAGRKLKSLNSLMQLDAVLGDQSELNRHYQRYLATLAENGLLEMSLVGGYGVIETAMFRGRRSDAGLLLEPWADAVVQTNDAPSILLFAKRQLAKGRLWTTIALLEKLAAKCSLDAGVRFEAEALRCTALGDLRKLAGAADVSEKGLIPKVQADWAAPIGKDGLDKMFADATANARRSFAKLSAPTGSQQALKARLDKIDKESDKAKNK